MYTVIDADGKQYGPVPLEVLESWVREGRVLPGTTIVDPVLGFRALASEMAELRQYFPPPVAAAPPVQFNSGALAPLGSGQLMVKPPKNKVVAGVLGILLGSLGIHRFYLGYTGIGILMLCITIFTLGFGGIITSIWGLVEGIMCLTGNMTDSDGRPLVD